MKPIVNKLIILFLSLFGFFYSSFVYSYSSITYATWDIAYSNYLSNRASCAQVYGSCPGGWAGVNIGYSYFDSYGNDYRYKSNQPLSEVDYNNDGEPDSSDPPPPSSVTCWDGSEAPTIDDCPIQPPPSTIPTRKCWDNSDVPITEACPIKPGGPNKVCDGGVFQAEEDDCPVLSIPGTGNGDGSTDDPSNCPVGYDWDPTWGCTNGNGTTYPICGTISCSPNGMCIDPDGTIHDLPVCAGWDGSPNYVPKGKSDDDPTAPWNSDPTWESKDHYCQNRISDPWCLTEQSRNDYCQQYPYDEACTTEVDGTSGYPDPNAGGPIGGSGSPGSGGSSGGSGNGGSGGTSETGSIPQPNFDSDGNEVPPNDPLPEDSNPEPKPDEIPTEDDPADPDDINWLLLQKVVDTVSQSVERTNTAIVNRATNALSTANKQLN